MDQLFPSQRLFNKEKHILKGTIVNLSSILSIYGYYKPWARSWVENHSKCIKKMHLCLGVGFVSFILKFETDKVLGKDIIRCNLNDVTIPHALCIEKNILYYVICFREGWYGFRKTKCCDPEHRITLCEINSIKTDNIGGYIINWITTSPDKPVTWLKLFSYRWHLTLYSNSQAVSSLVHDLNR